MTTAVFRRVAVAWAARRARHFRWMSETVHEKVVLCGWPR
jgi:hypothetical protein